MNDKQLRYGLIAGCGYSGTTMLSILVNGYPDVVSPGEMGPARPFANPEYLCSCGAFISECPFYARVIEEARRDGIVFCPYDWKARFELDLPEPLRKLLQGSWRGSPLTSMRDRVLARAPWYSSWRQKIGTRIVAIAAACLRASGASVFVDASKAPARITDLAETTSVDLRVIHLVRDPRGYAASAARRHGTRPVESAREWARLNQDVLRRSERLRVPYLLVAYEDLCQQTASTLARVRSFLGLPEMSLRADRLCEHHVIGNQARFRDWVSEKILLDERWKSQFVPAEQSRIVRVARETCGEAGELAIYLDARIAAGERGAPEAGR